VTADLRAAQLTERCHDLDRISLATEHRMGQIEEALDRIHAMVETCPAPASDAAAVIGRLEEALARFERLSDSPRKDTGHLPAIWSVRAWSVAQSLFARVDSSWTNLVSATSSVRKSAVRTGDQYWD
jgi:hypothetical protein